MIAEAPLSIRSNILFRCFGPRRDCDQRPDRRERWAETAKPTPVFSATQWLVLDDTISTSASFGDWVMRCQRTAEGDKAVRVCEAGQTIQAQGQAAPIAQIGIGRLTAGEPLRITIMLPPNIALPSNVPASGTKKDGSLGSSWFGRWMPSGRLRRGRQARARNDQVLARAQRGRKAVFQRRQRTHLDDPVFVPRPRPVPRRAGQGDVAPARIRFFLDQPLSQQQLALTFQI